jgi:carboxyl-terminal processing protease
LSTGAKWSSDLFDYAKNLEIFAAIYEELGNSYVDEIQPGDLSKKAIDAMLKGLDPYTVFFSEYQAEEALIERQGEYGGVGCRVIQRNQYPMISELFRGYAFDKAGVQLGDYILKVGDVDLKNQTPDELMQYFRGAPNSKFQVTVKRNKDTLIKSVTRTLVETKSVSHSGFLTNPTYKNLGYIKLDEFGQGCAGEIRNAIKKMQTEGTLQGLILDLRDNGGGLLDQAVDIVGAFVPQGTTVVTLKGAHEKGPKTWKTQNAPIAINLPLVVLINNKSASASEVVSGSLQDLDRAVILGQNSFGKGLVQNYAMLPYRTQMKLTTARYYTPSGRCIQRLQYQDRDELGNAKTQTKKSFKTTKGRTVFDAAGVDPDIEIPLFNGNSLIHWMNKNYLLFDWANQYFSKSNFNPLNINQNDLLENFKGFCLQQAPLILKKSLTEHSKKLSQDSLWVNQLQLLKFQEQQMKDQIIASFKNHPSDYKIALTKELLQRIPSATEQQSIWLSLDPEIKQCGDLLLNPIKINQTLNPKQ